MKPKKNTKVVVAMSGGVDSSVSAALLKQEGYDVVGMFMKCWSSEDPWGEHCTTTDDERTARLVAGTLGIPFYSLNLVKEYKQRVVDYLLEGYRKGVTPNPDIMCNKEIKFGLFYEKARDLQADYVATGHYAQIDHSGERPRIYAGADPAKDQSYFLVGIDPAVLSHVLFPIGGYKKSYVRTLAKAFSLPNADRKDSQGICFIGKVPFSDFLKQYISQKPGPIRDQEGKLIGHHEGVAYYTIGQRKGLGLPGGPYYVTRKDIKTNTLHVSTQESDLRTARLWLGKVNWFQSSDSTNSNYDVDVRIRYRQAYARASLGYDEEKEMHYLVFKTPQRAVAPGQFAALYRNREMLGGAVIQAS